MGLVTTSALDCRLCDTTTHTNVSDEAVKGRPPPLEELRHEKKKSFTFFPPHRTRLSSQGGAALSTIYTRFLNLYTQLTATSVVLFSEARADQPHHPPEV